MICIIGTVIDFICTISFLSYSYTPSPQGKKNAQVRNEKHSSSTKYIHYQLIGLIIVTSNLRDNENHLTLVGASDGLAGGRAAGVDSAGLADVDDGARSSFDGGTGRLGSVGLGELDGVEVGEGHQGETLLEVLNDPLSIILAKVTLAAGPCVVDGLAGGGVLNGGSTSGGGGGLNGHDDGVTSGDVHGEVVGVVGVPLIPGLVSSKQQIAQR